MSLSKTKPTGREITFGEEEIIVSKTDPRGVITYANEVFMRVSGYSEDELLGQPHNIIRHPAMPRCVFRLMWDTIKRKEEIFAYVLNLAKSGSEYWVHAHVTSHLDAQGRITGYHSNRRLPFRDAVEKVIPLYAQLLAEESRYSDPEAGIVASLGMLNEALQAQGMDYSQFVFSLSESTYLKASI